MAKHQTPTWMLVIVVPVVLLIAAVAGLWLFTSLTATPLHPNPDRVPSVMRSATLPKWASAVKQGQWMARESVAGQNLPGLSVAVGIDGDLVWAEGFGYADLKSTEQVTPDHGFRIGTASMTLSAAAAGLLLEDGRLRLDDEIQTYVPAFPRKQWPVTLRQLMGHTAGIVTDGGDEGPLFGKHCGQPGEALESFAEESLRFEPGSRYRFSSYGWILVSSAVETAAKQPFLRFMREEVFDPLEMRDTAADSGRIEAGEDFPLVNLARELIHDPEATLGKAPATSERPGKDQATSYFPKFAADPKYGLHLMRPLDYSCYAGASVFVSTPSDLVRFGMAMHSGKLLQPATVELLQTSQRLSSGEDTGYGLGWNIEAVRLAGKQARMVGHNGSSLGGMVATLMTFPEYGVVVAVTSNISYADTAAIALKVAEAFVEQGRIPARN